MKKLKKYYEYTKEKMDFMVVIDKILPRWLTCCFTEPMAKKMKRVK